MSAPSFWRSAAAARRQTAPAWHALLALLLMLLAPWAARAQAVVAPARDALPPMVARQVSAHAWYVEGVSALGSPANQNFVSNGGFVVTPAGVVVIDALGSPAAAQRMLAEIRRVTPQRVTHVVVTHYHADHVYGLQVFKAAGARILAHSRAREYLQSETAAQRLEASRKEMAPWIDASTRLVDADEWLDGDRELTLGGVRLQIVHVGPSHTPEDLVVLLPQDQLLFAGDLVFRGRIPFVGQADSRQWIRSLDKLLAMDAKVFVPGHGPASASAREDLALTRDYLSFLRQVMGTAARNMDPWEDAYAAADWSRFEKLPLFRVANRMNAYNTYLLMEQESR